MGEPVSEKPFRTSPAMRRYAAACADPDVEPSAEARSAAAGIAADEAARWRKRPGFDEWLGAEVRRLLAARMWEVWAKVFREARDGNLTAAKLLTDRLAPDAASAEQAPLTFEQLARLARSSESEDGGPQP